MSRRPSGRFARHRGRAPHCLCGRYAPPCRSASLWNEDEETNALPDATQVATLRGQSTAPAGRSGLPAPLVTGCSLDSPCCIPAHPTPELAGLPTPTRGLGRERLDSPARPLRAASPRPCPRYRRHSRSARALSRPAACRAPAPAQPARYRGRPPPRTLAKTAFSRGALSPRGYRCGAPVDATRCAAASLPLPRFGCSHALRLGFAPVVARRGRVRVSAALRSKRCRAAPSAAPLAFGAALLIICADATRRPTGLLAGCARSSGLPRGGAPAPLPRRYALPPAQKL